MLQEKLGEWWKPHMKIKKINMINNCTGAVFFHQASLDDRLQLFWSRSSRRRPPISAKGLRVPTVRYHRVKHPLRRIDGGPMPRPNCSMKKPKTSGPWTSGEFSLCTTNKWWDVSLRWWIFCGVNCQPDLLQRFWGEGLLKTAPLPPCRVPRNQSAGTYFCCWLKLDQVLWLQFLNNLLRPLSALRVFGILSYSPFSFAFITQKLSSSSSGSVAVIASRRCLPFHYSLLSAPWCSLSGCVWTFKNDTLYSLKIVGHWCRHNGSPNISDVNITIPTSKESENTQ